MKRVLVTGAAGCIGLLVIKYLLAEGKYEITALDLKNKTVVQRMKKYRKRINVIYGDVNDRVLIEALVKDHDYIIHLASALPPLSDMKKGLSDAIDYASTENIVKTINYYNPKCHLFMASTTSMYLDKKDATVRSKIDTDKIGYFATSKYNAELLIKEKISNWTVYRIPLVLNNPKIDRFMYHGNKADMMDVVTKEDAALAFVIGLKYSKELNKKIFNIRTDSIKYERLLNNVLYLYGTSIKYLATRIFLEHDFYSPMTKDGDNLDELIHFRNDSIMEYYSRLKRIGKKRKIARWLTRKKEDGEWNNGKSI